MTTEIPFGHHGRLLSLKAPGDRCSNGVTEEERQRWLNDEMSAEEQQDYIERLGFFEADGPSEECNCTPAVRGIRWSDVVNGYGPHDPDSSPYW